MKKTILLFMLFIGYINVWSAKISGVVIDKQTQKVVAFATVFIKNTQLATASNEEGNYSLVVEKGTYWIVCKFIGYKTIEKKIDIENKNVEINFELEILNSELKEIILKPGENPANQIIQNAINKRSFYNSENKMYEIDAYSKAKFGFNRFFDSTVFKFLRKRNSNNNNSTNNLKIDTNYIKLLYFSETYSNIKYNNAKKKITVISSKVHGQGNTMGIVQDEPFNFYDNKIVVSEFINPRGFISPIANNAFNYYKYKLLGTYFENGQEINIIKVIPKHPYEPVFSGIIHIMENTWRIFALDLYVTKKQQAQFIDSMYFKQIFTPVDNGWFVKQQHIFAKLNVFTSVIYANILNINQHINTKPIFDKKTFDKILLSFDTNTIKNSNKFWDSVRPLAFDTEELYRLNYKDSVQKIRRLKRDSNEKKKDSLQLIKNKFRWNVPLRLILNDKNYIYKKQQARLNIKSFLNSFEINEQLGYNLNWKINYNKKINDHKSFNILLENKIGLSTQQIFPNLDINYYFRNKFKNNFLFSIGSSAQQINSINPLNEKINNLYYIFKENYVWLYQNNHIKTGLNSELGNGFYLNFLLKYEQRSRIDVLENPVFIDKLKYSEIKANQVNQNKIYNSNLFGTDIHLLYKFNVQYINYNGRLIELDNDYTTIQLNLQKSFKNILGSNIDFLKWQLQLIPNINLYTYGKMNIQSTIGGMIFNKASFIDYIHFNTNNLIVEKNNENRFQTLPYYAFSTNEPFYFTNLIEHHFNGFITNKIPFLKKRNCFLVGSLNTLYIKKDNYFYEYGIGLENIFKIIRVDYYSGFDNLQNKYNGLRFRIAFY